MRRRLRPRDRRGAASAQIASAAVVLAIVVGAGFLVMRSGGGVPDDGAAVGTPGSLSTDESPSASAGECPDARAPMVDLNVQAVTGTDPQRLMPPRDVTRLVRLAEDAGAQVISTNASFLALHPQPDEPYRYETVDRVVNRAVAQGLDVRLDLVGMPSWALEEPDGGFQAPRTEAELEQWAEFVRSLLVHLKGKVDYIEVWNEPNLQKTWSTGPNPVEFVRLLDVTYRIAQRVDPGVTVISGGLAGNDIGFLTAMYDAVDRLGLDGLPVDMLGVHPFNEGAPPEELDPGRVFDRDPYGTVDLNFRGFEVLHEIMSDNGDGDLEVYITQFGYSVDALEPTAALDADGVRASYVPLALDVATCVGYVAGLSWYNLHPTPWDPEVWALVDRDGRPNRTYAAIAAWTAGNRD